jgi:NAD(P) transhydrogenase subunit alpha
VKIGVVAETAPGERRVALVPEGVKALKSKGFEVVVEAGAGERAGFLDPQYAEAGAEVLGTAHDVFQGADLVVLVNGPRDEDKPIPLRSGSALLSFLNPGHNPQTVTDLESRNITSFAMELIPRITRAQSMDALSAMSTVAGYKGALLAADKLPSSFRCS